MEDAEAGHAPERPAHAGQEKQKQLFPSLSMPPAVGGHGKAETAPGIDLPLPPDRGAAKQPARSTASQPAQAQPAHAADGRCGGGLLWPVCLQVLHSIICLNAFCTCLIHFV